MKRSYSIYEERWENMERQNIYEYTMVLFSNDWGFHKLQLHILVSWYISSR